MTFTPLASDFYGFAADLTDAELASLAEIRAFMEERVRPVILDHWHRDAFPTELIPELGALGIVGAAPTRSRAFGTTDHTAFNNAGLTGIDFELDPIEYDSHTHHTNLDTYERILEGDARAAAIIVAFTAYQLAMREEMLPRFQRTEIPPG